MGLQLKVDLLSYLNFSSIRIIESQNPSNDEFKPTIFNPF